MGDYVMSDKALQNHPQGHRSLPWPVTWWPNRSTGSKPCGYCCWWSWHLEV